MSSPQEFFEGVLGLSSDTLPFARGIYLDVCVDLFAKTYGVTATVNTAKLSGTSVTNSSALCMTQYGLALYSTSAIDLTNIESVKVHKDCSSRLYLYSFLCGGESEFLLSLGNTLPSGYHTWYTQAMVGEVPSTLPPRNNPRLLMPK